MWPEVCVLNTYYLPEAAWGNSSLIFWECICTFTELVWISLIGFSFYHCYRQLLSHVVLSLGPFYWPTTSSQVLPLRPKWPEPLSQTPGWRWQTASPQIRLSGFAMVYHLKIHLCSDIPVVTQTQQLSLPGSATGVLIWLGACSSSRHCGLGWCLPFP